MDTLGHFPIVAILVPLVAMLVPLVAKLVPIVAIHMTDYTI